MRRLLRGSENDEACCPPPRDEVPEQLSELDALLSIKRQQVMGELVEDQDVQREPAVSIDAALAVGQ